MSKKLDFSVGDLVRHRLHAERLGIIIDTDLVAYASDPPARVMWGGERLTWHFFSSLVRCNLPRTVV
jgi:hypothetical protein